MDELAKIIKSAESLFLKYGIRSITMTDIARDLGMSKKTLYVHVENKQDLVERIMRRYIQETQTTCYSIIEASDNALEALLKMSLYAQKNINDINPSLLFDLKKYHHPVWVLFNDFQRKEVLKMVEYNLKAGVEQGLFRADIDVPISARIHVSSMLIIIDVDFFQIEGISPLLLHRELNKYHINAIVSEKGRALLQTLGDHLDPSKEVH